MVEDGLILYLDAAHEQSWNASDPDTELWQDMSGQGYQASLSGNAKHLTREESGEKCGGVIRIGAAGDGDRVVVEGLEYNPSHQPIRVR